MDGLMTTAIIAVIVAFGVTLIVGHIAIPMLRKLKAGQHIRDDGPSSHLKKAGTPTMGGIIIMAGVIIAGLLLTDLKQPFMAFSILTCVAFGLVGMLDDMIKLLKHRSLGLRAYQKIILQLVLSFLISFFAYNNADIGSAIYIPFANFYIDLGFWYIPFTMLVIIATVNSVNLTDGLDGLASGVTLVYSAAFTIIFVSMAAISAVFAPQMAVFSAAVVGACLGFLRFNSYPAHVFMGDTGSFFLGAGVAIMAIIPGLHLLIVIMGIMYVLSSLSCIIQVLYFKKRGRRIFRMAPLHHHFELGGASETKIVATYMIVTTIACLISMLTLT